MSKTLTIAVCLFGLAFCGSTQFLGAQAATPPPQQAVSDRNSNPTKMTNADVVEMTRLGLNDEIIIAKIHAVESADFDTSVAGLKALKAAMVSDAVILAMINASRPETPPGATAVGGVTSMKSPKAPNSVQTAEAPGPITVDGFSFTLKDCVHGINDYLGANKVLNCMGLVENKTNENREITFTDGSLLDNLGNKYSLSHFSMYLGFPGILVLGQGGGNPTQELMPNLPMKFGFQMLHWNPDATSFNFVLKFTTAKDPWGSEIVLRNIPIQQ